MKHGETRRQFVVLRDGRVTAVGESIVEAVKAAAAAAAAAAAVSVAAIRPTVADCTLINGRRHTICVACVRTPCQ